MTACQRAVYIDNQHLDNLDKADQVLAEKE